MNLLPHVSKHKMSLMVFLLLLIYFQSQPSAQTDTTYGKTKTIDKTSNRGKTSRVDVNRSTHGKISIESDDCGCYGLWIDKDSVSLGGFFGAILIWPVTATACLAMDATYQSFKHLIIGSREYDENRKWFYGFGLKTGFSSMFSISRAYSLGLSMKTNRTITDYVKMGAMIEFAYSWNKITKDFQRNVYANETLIGIQKDITESYNSITIPIVPEISVFPAGRNSSFYISSGIGVCALWENVSLRRTENYSSVINHHMSISKTNLQPCFSFGLGRLKETGSASGDFEIRYLGVLTRNQKESSIPSDNTNYFNEISLIWRLHY